MSMKGSSIERESNHLIRALSSILKVTLFSIFAALVINTISWNIYGYTSTINSLENGFSKKIEDISNRSLSSGVFDLLVIDEFASHLTIDSHSIEKINAKLPGEISTPSWIPHFANILILTAKDHIAKILEVFSSWFLFILSYLLGTMDGLVNRYVRTVEGGRDSTFVFHKVSQRIMSVPILLLSFYLIVPLSLSPVFVIAGIAILIYVFSKVTASNLKKFI